MNFEKLPRKMKKNFKNLLNFFQKRGDEYKQENGVRTMETKIIKFDNNYPKLKNQKSGKLIAAIRGMTSDLLFHKFPDLMLYDTLRDDGFYYKMDEGETYILLLLLGNDGFLFTTLRKENEHNIAKYCDSIGENFLFEIKS